jgi:hypothetical protein
LAHHQRSALVLEALARGIADYGAPREILTDQGRQYTAWRGSTEFEAELRRHGIQHVKSRPHHPQTCGKIERFWKTMWEEFLARTVFADFEDCQRRTALFVQHYNFQRPHQALEGLTPADRFFRSASPVRAAIEATVAENALRLAREQQPRKPFYLVGRLGDRDLSISASGAAIKVRVGDEETMIPWSKESEHEDDSPSSARWPGTSATSQASIPTDPQVAHRLPRSAGGGAPALSDGVGGSFRRAAGERCDCAGADLPPDVLQAGDASVAGDARGVESAGLELSAGDSGEGADRAPRSSGEAPGATEATGASAVATELQVSAPASEDRSPWASPEDSPLAGDQERCPPFARQTDEAGHEPDDGAWRLLALRWERKLCAQSAASGSGEDADERAQTELYPPLLGSLPK